MKTQTLPSAQSLTSANFSTLRFNKQQIYILPRSYHIPDEDIKKSIPIDDWVTSQKFSSNKRQFEFRRVRYLYSLIAHHHNHYGQRSFTHQNYHVACAVTDPASQNQYIGIDLENLKKVKWHLKDKILSPSEQDLCVHEEFLGILFSFKEAIFKCLHPICQKMFYFHDVEVTHIDVQTNTIRCKLTKNLCSELLQGTSLVGYYKLINLENDDYVVTFCDYHL